MDIDELTELVQGKCFFAGAYKNTLEDVVEVREILNNAKVTA